MMCRYKALEGVLFVRGSVLTVSKLLPRFAYLPYTSSTMNVFLFLNNTRLRLPLKNYYRVILHITVICTSDLRYCTSTYLLFQHPCDPVKQTATWSQKPIGKSAEEGRAITTVSRTLKKSLDVLRCVENENKPLHQTTPTPRVHYLQSCRSHDLFRKSCAKPTLGR